MDVDCGVTIIGAGVVGLAIAAELSSEEQGVYVLERNATWGAGISSRNSEVIHAGIYHPPDSLKTRLCIEGRELLYETCAAAGIPHQRIGKLIIAASEGERRKLEELKLNATQCGLTSLQLIDEEQVQTLEPNVRAVAALYSPDTGIVSAHHLMDYYARRAKRNGAEIVCGTTVMGIERVPPGYRIETTDSSGERCSIVAERVVNAAGLHADEIAYLAGKTYLQHYCKGDYFSVSNVPKGAVRRLIYPVPEKDHVGLGVHLTLDLGGRMRLGPDATYIERAERYGVDESKGDAFYAAASRYLPFLRREHVAPDMSGIRPKLQGPGMPFRDFVISEDFPGFVNCVGIESPGLTAAPAIARYVRSIFNGTAS